MLSYYKQKINEDNQEYAVKPILDRLNAAARRDERKETRRENAGRFERPLTIQSTYKVEKC
jgi:hypothetical protein